MSNIVNEVLGDDLILIILEEFKIEKISVREAFERIREILKINLELYSAKKNVHNAVLIAKLIAAKLFPSFSLNPVFLKMLDRQEIRLTEDNKFGERITESGERVSCTVDDEFPSAITIGCCLLIVEIRHATSDSELKIIINKLDEYIDSTGDILRSEEF